MYEQAIKENEEFDRKKTEEAKHYSDMYEQALKENEEFDKKKIEEAYQSLIDKEAQARQEWKDNMSEETYYNYKNTIKDRLEFEDKSNKKENDEKQYSSYKDAKKEYDDVSKSTELLNETQKIAKHFRNETVDKIKNEMESSDKVR